MINLSTISKVEIFFDDVESIQYWSLLIRDFDRLKTDINIDTNQIYLNNITKIRIAQPLGNNEKA